MPELLVVNTIEKRRTAVQTAIETTNEKLEAAKTVEYSKENEKMLKTLACHLEVLERMKISLAKVETPAPPQSAKVTCTLAIYREYF